MMEESPIDLMIFSEPSSYLDWRGALLGLLIFATIAYAVYLDWQDAD